METAASSSTVRSVYAANLVFYPALWKTAALVLRRLAPWMSVGWAEELALPAPRSSHWAGVTEWLRAAALLRGAASTWRLLAQEGLTSGVLKQNASTCKGALLLLSVRHVGQNVEGRAVGTCRVRSLLPWLCRFCNKAVWKVAACCPSASSALWSQISSSLWISLRRRGLKDAGPGAAVSVMGINPGLITAKTLASPVL